MLRPAVFLDRDDTLIATREATAGGARVGDLADASLVRLLPGAGEACGMMRSAGYGLVIVSNQGCVARGNARLEDVERVNARVRALLFVEGGVEVAGVYCCPFHPEGTVSGFVREHAWRKPSCGMVVAAAEALGIDVARSWLVGDALRDLECGRRAGITEDRLIRVRDGSGDGGFDDVAGGILLREAGELIAASPVVGCVEDEVDVDGCAWPSGLVVAGTCWPDEVAGLRARGEGS